MGKKVTTKQVLDAVVKHKLKHVDWNTVSEESKEKMGYDDVKAAILAEGLLTDRLTIKTKIEELKAKNVLMYSKDNPFSYITYIHLARVRDIVFSVPLETPGGVERERDEKEVKA